jgi:hypothetical protein
MLPLAIALLLLGVGAGLAPRYMRRRPGIPPVCYDLAGVLASLAAFAAVYAALLNFGIDVLDKRWGWDAIGVGALLLTTWMLYRRSRAGKVLLDLGPASGRVAILVLAGILFLGGAYDLRRGDRDGPGELGWALFFLATGMTRRQLREAGIWKDGSLIRWPGVAGYLVEEDGTVRLKLKYSVRRPKLRVPEERREEFFRLLEDRARLSGATPPPG